MTPGRRLAAACGDSGDDLTSVTVGHPSATAEHRDLYGGAEK